MAEEIFDIVDEEDRVLRQERRSVVHTQGLLHRAVSVFVFNSRGELLLQRRSATKDEYPGCWTSSASGHLSAGESYDECAPRELEEELGLCVPLERLQKFPGGPHTANEHTVLYRAYSDDPPDFNREEIASVSYHGLREIAAMLERSPEEFTPPFKTLFRWYVANVSSAD